MPFIQDLIGAAGKAAFNPEDYRNTPVYDANNNITGFTDQNGQPTNVPMRRPSWLMRMSDSADTGALQNFNSQYANAPINSAQQRDLLAKGMQSKTASDIKSGTTVGGAIQDPTVFRGMSFEGTGSPSRVGEANQVIANQNQGAVYTGEANALASGSQAQYYLNQNQVNLQKDLAELGWPAAAADATTATAGETGSLAKLNKYIADVQQTPDNLDTLRRTTEQQALNKYGEASTQTLPNGLAVTYIKDANGRIVKQSLGPDIGSTPTQTAMLPNQGKGNPVKLADGSTVYIQPSQAAGIANPPAKGVQGPVQGPPPPPPAPPIEPELQGQVQEEQAQNKQQTVRKLIAQIQEHQQAIQQAIHPETSPNYYGGPMVAPQAMATGSAIQRNEDIQKHRKLIADLTNQLNGLK